LIPKYSFIWAWIVTLFSQILLTLMGYYYTRNLIKFHLPISFILKNIILWIVIFSLWIFILNNYSLWLYLDFFVYWGILFSLYVGILLLDFKK
jgi:O-antigen/teichoic acid export membrane protein